MITASFLCVFTGGLSLFLFYHECDSVLCRGDMLLYLASSPEGELSESTLVLAHGRCVPVTPEDWGEMRGPPEHTWEEMAQVREARRIPVAVPLLLFAPRMCAHRVRPLGGGVCRHVRAALESGVCRLGPRDLVMGFMKTRPSGAAKLLSRHHCSFFRHSSTFSFRLQKSYVHT